MTAPEPDSSGTPNARRGRFRRGRRPLLVIGGVVAALTLAGAATGITLGALGSDGPGPGGHGPDHHRHGPPVPGQDGDGHGKDRLVPPDQD